MNTPQSLDSRELRSCRRCGHLFHRVHGSCPKCGTLRDSRRPKRLKHRIRQRVEHYLYKAKTWYEANRWYVVYVGGGAALAALIQPAAMFLAEFSRPPDWRERRWEAGWSLEHFFEPFVAAGETLWRWLTVGTMSALNWSLDTLAWLIMAKPSTVFAILVGGSIGAYFAWRRTQRQRKRKQRSRPTASRSSQSLPNRPPPSVIEDVAAWDSDSSEPGSDKKAREDDLR